MRVGGWVWVGVGRASCTTADCGVCVQTRPEITEQIAQLASSPLSLHTHTLTDAHTHAHKYKARKTNIDKVLILGVSVHIDKALMPGISFRSMC